MHESDIERAKREELRWRILCALDAGRPGLVSETLLQRVLAEAESSVPPRDLRGELTYLRDKALIAIVDTSAATWLTKLAPLGVDVVQYSAEVPVGIERPQKNW